MVADFIHYRSCCARLLARDRRILGVHARRHLDYPDGGEIMSDPTVIPWSVVWLGLVLVICGVTLALHGVGQRRPSRVADVGGAVVVSGAVLTLGTLLANGIVMLAKAFSAVAQQIVASMR